MSDREFGKLFCSFVEYEPPNPGAMRRLLQKILKALFHLPQPASQVKLLTHSTGEEQNKPKA